MSIYPRADSAKYGTAKTTYTYNGVESYSESQVVRSSSTYRDGNTQARKRPAIPYLSPTPLQRFSKTLRYGSLSYYIRQNNKEQWLGSGHVFGLTPGQSFSPYGAWNMLPGVSVSGNGTPTITRNIDVEWLLGNKLLENIKDLNLQLPVTILEGRMTGSWLAQRVTSLSHAFSGVKRGKWDRVRDAINGVGGGPPKAVAVSLGRYGYKRPKRYKNPNKLPERPPEGWSAKPAAERWLEVQYAFKPLMMDVEGSARALALYLDANKLALCTRRARTADVKYRDVSFSHSARAAWPSATVSIEVTSLVQYRMQVHYVFDSYLEQFSKNGLTNLPSSAYELIPYSMVADWFITVGDYLELMDATVGCKFMSGVLSRKLLAASKVAKKVIPSGFKSVLLDPPELQGELYDRAVMTAFPRPQVVVKSPISSSHVITALALIRASRR